MARRSAGLGEVTAERPVYLYPGPRSSTEFDDAGGAERLPSTPPAGMRDVLPPEAEARRAVSRTLLQHFERNGYQFVSTPVFEYASSTLAGDKPLETRSLVRFIEPESGEIAVLRPDITPQIERIAGTRLAHLPPPWRLCYEGNVFRSGHTRARTHRQVSQAGLECIGLASPEGEIELSRLAVLAARACGLTQFRLELAPVHFARAALAVVAREQRASVAQALSHKDTRILSELLIQAGVGAAERGKILALAELYGDRSVLGEARRLFRTRDAAAALETLEAVIEQLATEGLADVVSIELGEVRGISYYAGIRLALLAEGPGEPLATGGHYDATLAVPSSRATERGTQALPGHGMAFDIDNLVWAAQSAGARMPAARAVRVVIVAPASERALARRQAEQLREGGAVVCTAASKATGAALAYARAWGYDVVLTCGRSGCTAVRVHDAAERTFGASVTASAIERWARAESASAS